MRENPRKNLREILGRFGEEPPRTLDKLREKFDAVAEYYGADWNIDELNRIKSAPIMKGWEGNILEIGCGNGCMIEKFINPDCQVVYGVDFSSEMLRCAKRRFETGTGDVFLIQADGNVLPFKGESFDGVICLNTILNIPDRAVVLGILREASRVLRPSGLFLLEFRNSLNPERRRIKRRKAMFALQETFSYFEIMRIVKSMNLHIEKATPLSSDSYTLHRGPRIYILFRRMLSAVNYRLKQWHLFSPCVCVVMKKGRGAGQAG